MIGIFPVLVSDGSESAQSEIGQTGKKRLGAIAKLAAQFPPEGFTLLGCHFGEFSSRVFPSCERRKSGLHFRQRGAQSFVFFPSVSLFLLKPPDLFEEYGKLLPRHGFVIARNLSNCRKTHAKEQDQREMCSQCCLETAHYFFNCNTNSTCTSSPSTTVISCFCLPSASHAGLQRREPRPVRLAGGTYRPALHA